MKKTFLLVLLLSLSFALGQTVAQSNVATSTSTSNFNSSEAALWVTVTDYCSFLNAVAAEDSYSLYNELMGSATCNLIVRVGTPGDYSYLVVPGKEELPICWVTWFDAARFCNWKENGAPDRKHLTSTTTEVGSYTLNGAMSGIIPQNQGVTYMLPSNVGDISDVLQSNALHVWGSLDDAAIAIPVFSASEKETESCDPTLASSEIGFCLLSFQEDAINYASLAAASQGTESSGIWSDAGIGAGIAIVGTIASLLVYHRCLRPATEMQQGGTASAAELAAERRDANDHQRLENERAGVPSSNESTSERAGELQVGAESSDAVVINQDNERLAQLQAESEQHRTAKEAAEADLVSLQAKIAENERMILVHQDKTGELGQQNQNLGKQIEEYQQEVAAHKETIAQHEAEKATLQEQLESHQKQLAEHQQQIQLHQETINKHEQTIISHQEALAEYTNPQERAARLASFQEENKKMTSIDKLLSKCAALEELCLKGKGGTETLQENIKETSVHSTNSSASRKSIGSNSSAAGEAVNAGTAFQNFRGLVQDATIKQQHYLERKTKGYLYKEEALAAVGQIQTQLGEAVIANDKLAEFLGTLRVARKNLWKHRGQIMDDFADHQTISQQLKKISNGFNEIENSAPILAKKIATCFADAHSVYESNEVFNKQRLQQDETKARTLAAASVAAGASAIKTTPKKKPSFSKTVSSIFHHSSPDKTSENFAKESEQNTACNAITTKIQDGFSTVIIPATDKVESCMTQSYALLHLAEKNAVEGMRLMRLYEADKEKKVWEISPLRHYLVSTLEQARELIATVQDFFGEVKGDVYQFAAFTNEQEIEAQKNKIATRVGAEKIEVKRQQAQALYQGAQSIQQHLGELHQKERAADLFEEASIHNAFARNAFYEAIRSINGEAQQLLSPAASDH